MGNAPIKSRTLFICDNLRVLRGIESETIDLIATDPPYNAKRSFNAPLGTDTANAKFDDRWKWDEVADEWMALLGGDNAAIREIIEAAAVIEGGTVNWQTGEIDTGRTKNSIAAFLCWMAPRLDRSAPCAQTDRQPVSAMRPTRQQLLAAIARRYL